MLYPQVDKTTQTPLPIYLLSFINNISSNSPISPLPTQIPQTPPRQIIKNGFLHHNCSHLRPPHRSPIQPCPAPPVTIVASISAMGVVTSNSCFLGTAAIAVGVGDAQSQGGQRQNLDNTSCPIDPRIPQVKRCRMLQSLHTSTRRITTSL